jgi:23S rRNA (adenine2503-C2)-methyltransferase
MTSTVKIIEKLPSNINEGTIKYGMQLRDGNYIESVLISYENSLTLCISSQVGCQVKCQFCRTGKDPYIRNLNPDEIMEQTFEVQKDINGSSKKIDTVSYMGMGEALHNFNNVIKSMYDLRETDGWGSTRLFLSTVGIVPKMRELARYEDLEVNLFISLNVVDDDLRKQLIPLKPGYSIQEILDAAEYYALRVKTEKPVTLSYLLLHNVNDRLKDARKLVKLVRGKPFRVYLKQYCEIDPPVFQPSKNIKKFKEILEESGIDTTVNPSKGLDVQGGCGQLRQKYLKKKSN